MTPFIDSPDRRAFLLELEKCLDEVREYFPPCLDLSLYSVLSRPMVFTLAKLHHTLVYLVVQETLLTVRKVYQGKGLVTWSLLPHDWKRSLLPRAVAA
jgi:hypothetical protein